MWGGERRSDRSHFSDCQCDVFHHDKTVIKYVVPWGIVEAWVTHFCRDRWDERPPCVCSRSSRGDLWSCRRGSAPAGWGSCAPAWINSTSQTDLGSIFLSETDAPRPTPQKKISSPPSHRTSFFSPTWSFSHLFFPILNFILPFFKFLCMCPLYCVFFQIIPFFVDFTPPPEPTWETVTAVRGRLGRLPARNWRQRARPAPGCRRFSCASLLSSSSRL